MGRLTALKPRVPTLKRTSATPYATTPRQRGSAWMKTRDRILRRDNGLCQCDECQAAGRVRLAHEVDHRIPLWKGGADSDENLQAINTDCHARKTAAEAKERAGSQ